MGHWVKACWENTIQCLGHYFSASIFRHKAQFLWGSNHLASLVFHGHDYLTTDRSITLIHLKFWHCVHILPLMCDSTQLAINLGQLDVHVDNLSNVFCLTSLNSVSLISFPLHIRHPFYITRNRLKLKTSNIQFD